MIDMKESAFTTLVKGGKVSEIIDVSQQHGTDKQPTIEMQDTSAIIYKWRVSVNFKSLIYWVI